MPEKMPSSLSKAVWRPAKLPMFLLVSEALFALLLRQARVMGKEVEKLRKLGFLMDNLNAITMHHYASFQLKATILQKRRQAFCRSSPVPALRP